jgi:hypothetical protein
LKLEESQEFRDEAPALVDLAKTPRKPLVLGNPEGSRAA